jgi:hypothetical protein
MGINNAVSARKEQINRTGHLRIGVAFQGTMDSSSLFRVANKTGKRKEGRVLETIDIVQPNASP